MGKNKKVDLNDFGDARVSSRSVANPELEPARERGIEGSMQKCTLPIVLGCDGPVPWLERGRHAEHTPLT